MNVTVHDLGRYECAIGTFTDFPLTLEADETPPRVAAFSHWRTDDGHIRRRTVDGVAYADITHQDRVWTYRLSPAYTVEPSTAGGLFQWPQFFDVGELPD
ncbi:hypothetical protein [uncultured Gordonia sp.]|uniref:hypothetical protein n=1 Tax=uncultured Gordonia sp. TaxID=198437 RepID=UPI002594901F|nr:hypothetical protein [uncultured Gordonia sp.]